MTENKVDWTVWLAQAVDDPEPLFTPLPPPILTEEDLKFASRLYTAGFTIARYYENKVSDEITFSCIVKGLFEHFFNQSALGNMNLLSGERKKGFEYHFEVERGVTQPKFQLRILMETQAIRIGVFVDNYQVLFVPRKDPSLSDFLTRVANETGDEDAATQ